MYFKKERDFKINKQTLENRSDFGKMFNIQTPKEYVA